MFFPIAKGLLIASLFTGSMSGFAASPTTLIYGRGGDSVSLDPAKETDGESLNVCDNIFDTLVRFRDGTTEIEPGLATSWDMSKDGKTYTFKLRQNVKFHDGTPFNADAVIFSWMRQHDPKHEAFKYSKAWQYWNDMGMNTLIESMRKIDDHTLEIKLTRPEAPFLANIAMQFAMIVSPTAVRKHKEDFAKKPVGTGPFKFASWARGEKVILDANPEYWGFKPKLKKVIFRAIPDSAARLNAFLSREIHIMNLPSPDQIAVVKNKRKDAKILVEPSLTISYLAFNLNKPPFDNPKVRQALNMAVNKAAIIKGVYAGMGVAAVNPIPPAMWGYNKQIKGYAYDIAKAKALLKEAGFPNGFKAELMFPSISRPYMPDGKKLAEVIQADFKKIGVDVTLTTNEWATYLDKTKTGAHEMALFGWNGDNGDPDNFLYVLLSGENTKVPASNISFYKNKEVDALLNKAKVTAGQKERAALYQKAQELIFKDAPWIPIAHTTSAMPMDGNIEGFVGSPLTLRQFYKTYFVK